MEHLLLVQAANTTDTGLLLHVLGIMLGEMLQLQPSRCRQQETCRTPLSNPVKTRTDP